ncbi:sugar ABC transporter substrate-binding protein [Dactylosporangium sucinum]|uniref:Sugar ABC transporter substrate-binding protein n=1 Tax=Dactylosporangium sucinum TaxID=1424081 RepID=A0A917U4G9_9ACTN|nr:sugar ABC transporter substrate-binding protein [Dactylosporangium sucinum]
MNVRLSTPRRLATIAIALTMALPSLTACGDDEPSSSDPNAPVTLTWWHNGAQDPGKSVWQGIADEYSKAHPNVKFQVEPTQNEALKTKISVALQSPTPPNIFQQWGGGALATQVESGKLYDMTADTKDWISSMGASAQGWAVDGKQYGIPYDLHVVGFWYRKDLFEQAGIAAPPKTMTEFNDAVTKLKAKGITPVSLGGKDKWPDAFWWSYFAIRECSLDVLKNTVKSLKMDDACFVKAGEDLKKLIDSKPFQDAFLGTPAQQGAGSSAGLVANGKAAMELQGDWELPTMIPLTEDKDYAKKLSWFPFPEVEGGKGTPGTALGGGDGFSCSVKGGAACADFLKYIASTEVQTKLVTSNTATLPANPAAISAIQDPSLKTVQEALNKAPYIQVYFDQALPTSVGQALNDAIADFFAGKGSPQGIVDAFNKAVANK